MAERDTHCWYCNEPLHWEDSEFVGGGPIVIEDRGITYTFCSDDCWDECRAEWADDERLRQMDGDDWLIDGVGFADPGGRSALRAATPENPRNLPCPNCGRENMLTPLDVAHRYVCDICADEAEGGGY